ncbi:hypothetical protein E2C01_017912 [Portunus trituberculatus]|uniref:Uncharacterized protein n=1 Tax=Portunus trituberculatus TaxID=210409 RepID=A0A5B7DTQ7_PORTR|nr:hypothetical protein [Portunus trituberculatus]
MKQKTFDSTLSNKTITNKALVKLAVEGVRKTGRDAAECLTS